MSQWSASGELGKGVSGQLRERGQPLLGTNWQGQRVAAQQFDHCGARGRTQQRQLAIFVLGGIYVMNRDGSSLRKIAPLGDYGGLDWRQH